MYRPTNLGSPARLPLGGAIAVEWGYLSPRLFGLEKSIFRDLL